MVFVTAGEGGGPARAPPPWWHGFRASSVRSRSGSSRSFQVRGLAAQAAGRGGHGRCADPATTIVIPNDKLLEVLDQSTSMIDAFRIADDVLRQGVQGICDLITVPGLINLDFADVRTIMTDAGTALMGIGYSTSDDRARRRRSVPRSPLIDTEIVGAKGILLSIAAARICRCSRSTRRRRSSARPPPTRRTSSSARRSTSGCRGRCGSPSSRRGSAGTPQHADVHHEPGARGTPRASDLPRQLTDANQAVRAVSRSARARAARPASPPGCARPRGAASSHSMRGAIAAGHPLTAEAGARVLADGGGAVDACIAAAFVSWVVESPVTGPGGGGFMLVHRARDRTSRLVDFFVTIPGLGLRQPPPRKWRTSTSPTPSPRRSSGSAPPRARSPGAGRARVRAPRLRDAAVARLLAPAIDHARRGVELTRPQAHLHAVVDLIAPQR